MDARETGRETLTLAIIGCGNLGTAILIGLIASHEDPPRQHGTITRFLVSVQTAAQKQRITQSILKDTGGDIKQVEFLIANNIECVSRADVVILTCPPHQLAAVLGPDMCEALAGKLLISMMGGISIATMERKLESRLIGKDPSIKKCHILRAVTNIGARVGNSITIVEEQPLMSPQMLALGKSILGRIGSVMEVKANQMPAATALTASGTAFFALLLEAAVDGAVALGIRHDQAIEMAAQTMAGVADLTLSGYHPALVRTQVITPGGSTARGMGVLEEGAVRGKIIQALRETASMHSK